MNQNTINVVEATPAVVNALKLLKQRTPTMNENSSTKPFGSNGGIKFTTNGGEVEGKVQGAFDVEIETIENSPYIHVYNSANPGSGKAGYIYSGSTTWELNSTTLTPMVGVVYVDVNYASNTRTIAIAATLPTLTSTDRRWVYALAEVTQSNGIYTVHRMNMPGNLTVTNRWVS